MQLMLMGKGIRVSDDDPLFAMIALNEIVLEDMTKKHWQTLNSASAKPLSSQTAGISCQAHHKSAVSGLKIIAGASFVFACGMLFGSEGLGLMLQGSVGLAIGTLLGIMLSYLTITRIEEQQPSANTHVLDALSRIEDVTARIGGNSNWTDDRFQQVVGKITSTLSDRTLNACRDVLVHGMEVKGASEKNNTLTAQVYRGLSALRTAAKEDK